MIKYALICKNEHPFEGWFSNSKEYEQQRQTGLLSCPVCNSVEIDKSLMAPSISPTKSDAVEPSNENSLASNASVPENYSKLVSQLREIRSRVMADAEDVGKNFPEEARKIHYGETQKRGIFGQASKADVDGLVDEGIEVVPIPVLPEDNN